MSSGLGKASGWRDLSRLFRHGTVPSGDRALLDRLLDGDDESAFEALVDRHGPMVMGVCRRLLASPHDADDAFQATFLVLIRKASGLRDADRLAPWLYGVALRVANRARARAARHRDRHQGFVDDVAAPEDDAQDRLDVRPILDAELGQIPRKIRDVLVLCLLEGATAEEASRRLACPLGTVKSRLARGREALRDRLTRRGFAPAVAVAASSSAFTSHVSAALIRRTLGLVVATPGAIAPSVMALTRGIAPAMMLKTTLTASLILGGIALTGLGTTWLKPAAQAQAPAEPARTDAEQQTINNMKDVGLAMHNHLSKYNFFPPAAYYGKEGEPTLSWRVALLPFLGEQELFDAFRPDEPWDSPANKALLGRMPACFKTPISPTRDGETRLRGFSGKGAMFEGREGTLISEVTDGSANTLLITMASEAVPWTKPGELPFDEGQPLPELATSIPKSYLVGKVDCSVQVLPKPDDATLRAIITRAGGEVLAWSPSGMGKLQLVPIASPRPQTRPNTEVMMEATDGSAPPDSEPVVQRLKAVEEKLDLILKRLDATSGPAPARP